MWLIAPWCVPASQAFKLLKTKWTMGRYSSATCGSLLKTVVPPDALAVRHQGEVYVRTTETIRLTKTGTGMGKVFRLADVYERPRLEAM